MFTGEQLHLNISVYTNKNHVRNMGTRPIISRASSFPIYPATPWGLLLTGTHRNKVMTCSSYDRHQEQEILGMRAAPGFLHRVHSLKLAWFSHLACLQTFTRKFRKHVWCVVSATCSFCKQIYYPVVKQSGNHAHRCDLASSPQQS